VRSFGFPDAAISAPGTMASSSALWNAVSTPFRRPERGFPMRTISTYDLLGRPVDPHYLPYAIAKHTKLISVLVRNLQEYCEAHPQLGADSRALAYLRRQQKGMAEEIRVEPSTFVFYGIRPVLKLIRVLDHYLVNDGEMLAPVIGIPSSNVWRYI
jgi:hypothetical protein